MGADDWSVCPACELKHKLRIEQMKRSLDEAYGKIPLAEFNTLQACLESEENKNLTPSLQEYRDIGLVDYKLYVNIYLRCNYCFLEYTYDKTEDLSALIQKYGSI